MLLVLWYLNSKKTIAYRPSRTFELAPAFHPILSATDFDELRRQVLRVPSRRTSLGGWRSSSTTGAATLGRLAPACLDLYHSAASRDRVQAASGLLERLEPLPLAVPLSCALLRYDSEGDHISWHYDRNYFKGRTVTVLLTVINRNAEGTCCSGNQSCRMKDGREVCVDTQENSLVVFDGANVLHSTKRLGQGELRVVLSMVFCTDRRQSPWQVLCTSVKDWSFFG